MYAIRSYYETALDPEAGEELVVETVAVDRVMIEGKGGDQPPLVRAGIVVAHAARILPKFPRSYGACGGTDKRG